MGSESVEEAGNVCFAAAMFQVSCTMFYSSFSMEGGRTWKQF